MIQRGFEFEAATADVARRLDDIDLGGGVEERGWLDEDRRAHTYLSGHDETPRGLAGFSQATFEEQEVGTDTGHCGLSGRARYPKDALIAV